MAPTGARSRVSSSPVSARRQRAATSGAALSAGSSRKQRKGGSGTGGILPGRAFCEVRRLASAGMEQAASPIAAGDAAHLLRGFMRLSDRHRKQPLVIDRGKGVWVFDEHGTPYLEAVAGMW